MSNLISNAYFTMQNMVSNVMAKGTESGVKEWDIGNFLKNATSTLKGWVGMLIMLIGVVMIAVGIIKIAGALISHGKKQTSWAVNIILVILGGAFLGGGWEFVSSIASSGQNTIDELGKGNADYNKTIIFDNRDILPGYIVTFGE